MTDWRARVDRFGPDFRLPGDPPDIPSTVLRDRIREYLAQMREQARVARELAANPSTTSQIEPDQVPGGQRPLI